jgi:hypothetical protein
LKFSICNWQGRIFNRPRIWTSIIVSTAMTYIIIAGFSIFQEWFFELNQFDIYEKQCILPHIIS